MKTKKKHNSTPSAEAKPVSSNDPMSALEDPLYDPSEGVDREMTQAVTQQGRRMSRHGGKNVQRPQEAARTMGS